MLLEPRPKTLKLTLSVPDAGPPTLLVAVLGGKPRVRVAEYVFDDDHHSGTDLTDECMSLIERFLDWTRDGSFVVDDSWAAAG